MLSPNSANMAATASASLLRVDNEEELSALTDVKLSKLKKKINASNWSNELEDLMQSWGEKAAGLRELHDDAATYWKRFGDTLYVPVILLSTIGGVSNFGAASVDDHTYWMYGIGTINIITAALASVVQYYKPDEKRQHHNSVARNFGSFYRTMTLELGMKRDDRMNAEDMIRWAKNEYDRVNSEAPSIPDVVLKKFKNIHGRNKPNLPDIITCTYDIKINRPSSKCGLEDDNVTDEQSD